MLTKKKLITPRSGRLTGVIRDASRRAARMRLAERVVGPDPQFAGGYALQSAWYGLRVSQGQSASPQEDIERTLELARKSVVVNPMSAQAHAVLGHAYLLLHQHDKAVAAARELIRIQPSDANGYAALGYFQHWAGLGEKAINNAVPSGLSKLACRCITRRNYGGKIADARRI